MVVQTANEAVANADAYGTCEPGMCLKYVRTWLEIPSSAADAIGAWNAAAHKHPGDKHPPKGAPVFWKSGAGGSGHGHIALVRGSVMRSTDIPSSGKVGNDDGSWPRIHWGQTYLGWAEDLNGILIPYLGTAGSKWATGEVYVAKLHHGQTNSDSVARLCYRLTHHPQMPGSHRPTTQTSDYTQDILEAVRYWQRNIAPQVNGPSDGTSMSNPQANTLFGVNYTVVNK